MFSNHWMLISLFVVLSLQICRCDKVDKNFVSTSIVIWFRNETSLLVLWSHPQPIAEFMHYKVSVDPPDATKSNQNVRKRVDAQNPGQASFQGLVPGRQYNVSVQIVFVDELSKPTSAQYRTVPLKPSNVTFNQSSVTPGSFTVHWSPPRGFSEFDRYEVSVAPAANIAPVARSRDGPTWCEFKDGLEPGRTYQVTVKTVSGKVASWPATGAVTLPSLGAPVVEDLSPLLGGLYVRWKPVPAEKYEVEVVRKDTGDSRTETVSENSLTLRNLYPGAVYLVRVTAVSQGLRSDSQEHSQAVYARPVENLSIGETTAAHSVLIRWQKPTESLVSEYAIRHKAESGPKWVRLPPVRNTEVEISGLTPGEHYTIQVYTVSNGLESSAPQQLEYTVPPSEPGRIIAWFRNETDLRVVWQPPPPGTVFSRYQVSIAPADAKESVVFVAKGDDPPSVASAEFTGLVEGRSYNVSVQALSKDAASLPSSVYY